ncbi:CCA tRNA nucleotidyltransferase [Neoehrlichia mikurensis]|uniref:CCA tRNA nucleotidyltransferase n=1 Tax=Neoehrlichia mikurensis TaxID=89586 RepID=A0A9Q9BTH8_9RICK|nr:CCA tRNA nucleotidyltransferase [Neoehrlichia mikurensis]QXK91601.1 CCA tRNA nucleotidyltransferase [Neoehrlichia mikurensis]QXK92812.1 CCA tRNA nucleotidyltransferase [Neoehrlichia mikurensis]QXK93291.1 CCA tRNA nucleotidyltransferase [Neoehrlichia mikurensis]UTO55767.1 CCA tRNA nucleotidyltransferase [Neoehrlichia mikurensis]UTO56684.1 CCA tRNA nucleotidyltransferase [Neoehrlichia mikurensis]
MISKLIQNPNVLLIINAIEKFDGEIRLVGGCVRDSIINKKFTDTDFATTLTPNETIQALKSSHIKAIPTGIKHGTITAIVNNIPYEITTLRSDTKCDGRHANVSFTNNWEEDAKRRDFTFNALYCDKKGKIYDYFSGIHDLNNQTLNFIGNAEKRINEDFLRILRAFRFHAMICSDSQMQKNIIELFKKYSYTIKKLSKERVREEFLKLLSYNNISTTLQIMQQCNILEQILPYNISLNILSSPLLYHNPPIVKLSALLRTVENNCVIKMSENISNVLRLSNKQKKTLLILTTNKLPIPLSINNQKKNISKFGLELYCHLITISHAEAGNTYNELSPYINIANNFTIPKFPISGNDLLNIGYKKGKTLGQTLNIIKQTWENSTYQLTKTQLLSFAKDMLQH